jgi:hypothetical protein
MVKIKEVSLELIHLMLESYLGKFIFSESSDEKLHTLIGQLFPPKRLCMQQHDSLDLFADIVATVAKSKLDFAMHNIVFELLRGDTIIPEYLYNSCCQAYILSRMIVAVKAVLKISSFIDFEKAQQATNNSNKSKRSSMNLTKGMEAYIPPLSMFLSQILLQLDPIYGSLLLSNQTKNLAG